MIKQLSALDRDRSYEAKAGHLSLTKDVWLSCDPSSHISMCFQSSKIGFSLEVTNADSGKWACIGINLPIDILCRNNKLKFYFTCCSHRTFGIRPSIRSRCNEGSFHSDMPKYPLVFLPGQREFHNEIALRNSKIPDANKLELNLFFIGGDVSLSNAKIELSS